MARILSIAGTRPEIIRLSEIIKKLDKHTEHIFVYTNQSYDYELSQIFFDELMIRKPDYSLDVKSDTVGEQMGKIITQCEFVMIKEKPDALLILGDTNSALSCIVAKRLKIVVFHMEAGNRCFSELVPEEINRRIVDHTSDINLCYTEHARRNLLREGLYPQNIFVVGSPLTEVYSVHRKSIDESRILEELKLTAGKYFLASVHREENVDSEKNLCFIFRSLCLLSGQYEMPVIFSVHPRTRKRLEESGLGANSILFHKPFGMFDYIKLQQNAFCNLSDSGTIHEDAAILNIPVVVVRESQERPEAYDAGNVIMSGVDPDTIVDCVGLARSQFDAGVKFSSPYGYRTRNCSDKVLRLIVGLHKIVAERIYG